MAMTNVYTGAYGQLVLANEDTAEGRDAQKVIETFEIQTVGRVTDVRVYVNTHLEEFHEVGRRHPTSRHSGNIHISGEVGHAYVNGALLYLLMGRGARPTRDPEPYVQPAFSMVLTLADPAVPGVSTGLELKGVKFQNWAFTLPEDDFVVENLAFKALTIVTRNHTGAGGAAGGGGAQAGLVPEFAEQANA
jgi:hypothetical protein